MTSYASWSGRDSVSPRPVTLGAALALAASPWIEPLLFRQSPRDPAPFATAGLILLVTALVACALPALRASRTDPNVVLRGE